MKKLILNLVICLAFQSSYSQTTLADLAVTNFLFSPQTINVGEHPDAVSFRLTNNGPANLLSPNTHVDGEFFISRNTTFGDDDDIQIGINGYDFTLSSGSYSDVTLSATGRSYLHNLHLFSSGRNRLLTCVCHP